MTLQWITSSGRIDLLTVEGFFRWYDLWIGAYLDRERKTLYVCPVPMFGVKIVLHWLVSSRSSGAAPDQGAKEK